MKTSGTKRIAERYVKALFDVAQQSKVTDAVEKDLSKLGGFCHQDEAFSHFLSNPLITPNDRAGMMLAVLDKIGAAQLTRQFIGTLIQQKRLALLADIADLFAASASQARGELTAELITASALKPADVEMVAARLGKAYGKTVKLNVRQDPDLLGGAIVKIGSVQLDSSLAGKMRRLKQTLQAA